MNSLEIPCAVICDNDAYNNELDESLKNELLIWVQRDSYYNKFYKIKFLKKYLKNKYYNIIIII